MTLTGENEVLAYSLTIFGSSMISSLMGSALSFFYTDVLKIAAGAVGTIFIIARVWDAVNDPIMGVIVDRTHTKYGKCIPYLKAIPIPLFIVTLLVFLPIQNAGAAFKTVYAGILYILYFANFPGGVCATLTTLLISDCVEYAEWKTGERTEGITFSITKLITKTSAALISSLTMFILASVNYDPTAMQRTLDVGGSIAGTYPEVLNMIYILMTLSLSAAFILQMIPMLFYKFEGEEQKNILDELNARRANTDA